MLQEDKQMAKSYQNTKRFSLVILKLLTISPKISQLKIPVQGYSIYLYLLY